ncbi:MAG: hypothetical protein IPH07_22515 [Deltaproteobacteria bacterium]|nr:hypothetical protein [Deltaproteobacteria bacterium]MBK8240753.1 hypothetical protein [Deltaproteobacteria bacterium]MBK8714250.1 hypothetical protein [Deltaproteobacteria bacterium]MBP7285960.1 hypothetical protein [Nannocystaceae bacterium]
MRPSVFRIVVASTLVLQVLFAVAMLVAPLVMYCHPLAFEPDRGRPVLAHAIDSSTTGLFIAWCLRTALRWLPTQTSHALALTLGVGTMLVARGMLGLLLTPYAAFDVTTGVALVVVSGALWRARVRVTA